MGGGRVGDMPNLMPPEDQSIMTLYVGGLTAEINEKDLEDVFYAHGEVKGIKKIESKNCAFITYTSRAVGPPSMSPLFRVHIL
jgi:pre-mRNA-splicing factor RBM22/SLT11